MALEFDPLRDVQVEDPYPVYRRLRDEAPVHWSPSAELFCVSRYDDVLAILKDTGTFSSSAMQTVLMRAVDAPLTPRRALMLLRFLWRTGVNPLRIAKAGSLISFDPPRHDSVRKIVSRGFTPRSIAAWEPRVRAVVAEAVAGVEARARFDVVEDLAIPLPTTLIAELLGIAPERRNDFRVWSNTIVEVVSGSNPDILMDPEAAGRIGQLYTYIREQVRIRRERPEGDLISLIVDQREETALDEFDVLQFVILLLVAGNETTTNLIGNAVNALLDRPDPVEAVLGEPALMTNLVEEAVRFDSPVQMVFRTARRDVEVAGTRIPKGGDVACLLGSANRDERRFADPDLFDATRDTAGHLGFGFGVHFCLGAALARLETRAALEALVPLLPSLERSERPGQRLDSYLVRGLAHLELIPRKPAVSG